MPKKHYFFVVNSFNRILSAVTDGTELNPENMAYNHYIIDSDNVERFAVSDEDGEIEDTTDCYEDALGIRDAMVSHGGIYVVL